MHKAIRNLTRLVWPAMAWLLTIASVSAAFAEGEPLHGDFPRAWVSLEYLNLWSASAPTPFPLAVTSDAAPTGQPGSPDATVLLGNRPISIGAFPGFRATLGGWFSANDRLGAEISGFATGVRAAHFQAASDGEGNPWLSIPFSDVTSGTPVESALVVAQPGVRRGRISADDASIFGGIEADGLFKLRSASRSQPGQLAAIGGLRYITLWEQFQLSSVTTEMSGLSQSRDDVLAALNTFLGAEFGLRGGYRYRRVTLQLMGKAAFGTTWQAQSAASHGNFPGNWAATSSGLFTQSSNTVYIPPQRAFSVVPAARLRLSYDLTQRLRATLSYEALYWTNVIRPSNQFDREINLSQTAGPLVGAARPAAQHRQSDFWAQGLTAGLQLNF